MEGPAGVLRPFQESPAELRMSSVGRLLIFHASIGNEHVQTAAHFLPSALVWLHLTFCKIRTRFKSRSTERRLGERTLTERVAEKRLTGDDVMSAQSLRARTSNVTFQVLCHRNEAEPFCSASAVGRLEPPQCCFKSLISMCVCACVCVCGECFQLATHCLFMVYFLTPTYIILIPFLVKSSSAASKAACCAKTTIILCRQDKHADKNMWSEPPKTKGLNQRSNIFS